MKIFSRQNLVLLRAIAWGRRRIATTRSLNKLLLGVALLVSALAPANAFGAAAWSSAPINNVPVNTDTTYTMTGLSGSYSMWYRRVYFIDSMYSFGLYPYDRSDYGPWVKMGQTRYVGDTYISATIQWDSSVKNWQIKVVSGLNSANGQAVAWSSWSGLTTLLDVTVTSPLYFQQKPIINSRSTKAWSNGAMYPGPYVATVEPLAYEASVGPLVWQLSTGSTPGATIDAQTGNVTVPAGANPRYVKFYVYRAATSQCNASPPSNVFTLQVSDVFSQAAVIINSEPTTSQGSGYYATATGGNGTGALVWSVGAASTALDPKIGGAAPGSTSSTSLVTTGGPGTVVINVYRAADDFHLPSAVATMTLTVSGPVAAITKSVGEAITISSAVKGTNSDVTFTVNAEGSSPSIVLTGGIDSSIGESPLPVNGIFKPGKEYWITVTGNKCTDYWLNFTPPAGYTLLLDGQATNSIHKAISTGTAYSSLHSLLLRPEASFEGAPFGFFSGVRVDKAIGWDIGLGNLANGRSAGRVLFKENTLSNNPVSRAKLYYAAPENIGEIDVKYDLDTNGNKRLRQIRVPQGFLDIVDDPDSGNGYSLKFYTRANLNIVPSGTADTAIYTVHTELDDGPWKTIRVELTGEGNLKFTEKEI